MLEQSDAQARFDTVYISSAEIRRRCGVSSSAITAAQKRGLLPPPIKVAAALYLWERATVQAHLDAWFIILRARRGELVA